MAESKESSYEVRGTFRNGEEWKPYRKEIRASSESQAREHTYALIGSKHRLKRKYITIEAIMRLEGGE